MENKDPFKKKYFCADCGTYFASIKEYINHLDEHSKLINKELPKKKRSFLGRLFRRKEEEVMPMPKREEGVSGEPQEQPDEPPKPANEVDAKIYGLEKAVHQLTSLVAEQMAPKPEPVQRRGLFGRLPDRKEDKRVRITVLVETDKADELLKALQETEGVEVKEFIK